MRWTSNLLLYVLMLAGIVLLAACEGVGPDGKTPTPRTNIITGSTGSTWYTIGSGLAEKANLLFEGHPITAVPGAGGMSNPVRVSMTGMDLGISYGPFLRAAYRGEPPFRQALPELRVVATLILNTLHVVARPHLRFANVVDVVQSSGGLRVGAGMPGSGDLFCFTTLLSELGTSVEEWERRGNVLRLSGTTQRFDDYKDGHLEVAVTFINDPSPQLTELMVSRPGRFLPLPPELRQRLVEKMGFRELTVAPGSYPEQDYPVETVALPAILFTVEGVDESIVYALTRALYDNQPYLQKVHPGFHQWDPEDLPEEVQVPFHPGAIRFYRERGVLKAEPEPGV
jgi:hypothetical protein